MHMLLVTVITKIIILTDVCVVLATLEALDQRTIFGLPAHTKEQKQ